MSKHKTRQIARITEATLGLIEIDGLSRLSISKIADTAGITRQTVYNYFPDVESIIAHALGAHSDAATAQLSTLIQAKTGDFAKLQTIAEFLIEIASPKHESISLEAGLSAASRAQQSSFSDAIKEMIEQVVIDGINGHEFDAVPDIPTTSALIWGMIEGAANAATQHSDQKPYLIKTIRLALRTCLSHR